MTRRVFMLGGLGACAIASACSLLYSPSSEEFSHGNGEGGSSGITADGSSPSGVDGSSSSSSGDGAASSSSSGGDSSAPFVCPAGALVCDDFERVSITDDTIFNELFGSVSIATKQAHSPSRSLSALMRSNNDSPSVALTLQNVKSKLTVSFWFYASKPPPQDDLNFRITDFLWGDSCDWDSAYTLDLRTDGLRSGLGTYDAKKNASCGPVDVDFDIVASPAVTFVPKWHHVVMKHDVSQQVRHATVTFDDQLPQSLLVTGTRTTVPKQVRFSVGIPCVQENASGCYGWDGTDYEVLIDDVTIVETP